MRFDHDGLARIRRYSGISQADMARRCNMSRSSVCLYEKGKRQPGIVHAARMARVLGVPIEDFIDYEESLIPCGGGE